jgi:hypothetical protein
MIRKYCGLYIPGDIMWWFLPRFVNEFYRRPTTSPFCPWVRYPLLRQPIVEPSRWDCEPSTDFIFPGDLMRAFLPRFVYEFYRMNSIGWQIWRPQDFTAERWKLRKMKWNKQSLWNIAAAWIPGVVLTLKCLVKERWLRIPWILSVYWNRRDQKLDLSLHHSN